MSAASDLSTFLQRIAVVVPAYEPGPELEELIRALLASPFGVIVIVDDGSGPGYAPRFRRATTSKRVRLLHHPTNLGKGAALKTAFRHLSETGDHRLSHVITVDADGQHRPDDVLAVAARAAENPNSLVLGVRSFSPRVPLRSRFGNLLTRKVLRWIGHLDLQDTQTGLRCMPLDFASKTLSLDAERYEFELESLLLARRLGISIIEQPIRTVYIDKNSSSHFHPILDSLRIYWVFLRFVLVSLVSFVLDILLFTAINLITANILFSTYAARLVSGSFNYLMNKHSVFRSPTLSSHVHQLPGYILLATLIATLSGLSVEQLARSTGLHPTLAKILVDSLLFILSFLVQHFLIFSAKRKK